MNGCMKVYVTYSFIKLVSFCLFTYISIQNLLYLSDYFCIHLSFFISVSVCLCLSINTYVCCISVPSVLISVPAEVQNVKGKCKQDSPDGLTDTHTNKLECVGRTRVAEGRTNHGPGLVGPH